MHPAILLIGDYPPLLTTRAQLLSEWDPVVAGSIGAPEALKERPYQLLILSQSVPDAKAEKLVTLATSLHPGIKVLAPSYDGEHRHLPGSTTLYPDIYRPTIFRDVVADLLRAQG